MSEKCVCGYEGTPEGIFRHLSMNKTHSSDRDEWKRIKIIADMLAINTATGETVTQYQYGKIGKWGITTAKRQFDDFPSLQSSSLQIPNQNRKLSVICYNCGSEKMKHPSRINNADKTFCSEECYNKNRESKWIKFNCKNCNNEFEKRESYVNSSSIDKESIKFCCKKCEINFVNHESKCKMCGDKFEFYDGDSDGIFCSRKCYNNWRKRNGDEIMGGENNPMWLGGHDSYRGPNWETQRKKALDRDKYKCKRCGISNEEHKQNKGCELHVHHKTRYAKFDDYKEANKLENLIVLCQICHNKVENRFKLSN